VTELAHDPPADLLDHGADVGVGRGLTLKKPGCASLIGTIQIDPLQEDEVEMEIQEKSSITPYRPP